MAKKADKPSEKCTAGIAAVGVAIAKAYGKQAISGELLDTVITVCERIFGGNPANSIDQKRVAEDVARIQGWTKASEGPRKSEVRKIVRNYNRFGEAAAAYKAKHDTFTWHTAMKLLTCLNKEKTLSKALALMTPAQANVKVQPMKVMGNAISKIMNLESKAAKVVEFQDALETLCRKQDIDW